MIRWRFVVTRLFIILAVLLLVRLGMGPVARYVTVKGLQSTTGSKVEIGSAQVGLFPPSVRYEHFRVADPRDDKALRDAFRADSIELSLDGEAMLHRRWVARDGKITGLQIGASREESGHLESPPSASDIQPRGTSALSNMLGGMSDQLKAQAQETLNGLETVRRSEEIKSRWERDYNDLVTRAKSLEGRVREFRDQVRGVDNPLRDWPNLDRTFTLASEARAELKAVRASIDQLPGRFQADLISLDQAKQVDLDRIDQYVPGNLADSKNFGVDLISEAVHQQIASIREYWEGGRKIADYTIVAPESFRDRGVDIDLLGDNRQPGILVKRCEVSGMMRADGNAYSLTGVVENMTPSPELLTDPLRARLQLDGPQVVRVDYVRDRRGETDVDRLTLQWPQSDAPEFALGTDKDAMVSMVGGKREVWVQLRSEGDQIQGRFVSKQTGVRLGLDVDSKYESLPATMALRDSLAAVDTVEIDAGFNGTWDELQMDMNTNLGQILQRATSDAVNSQLAASKKEMTERINRAHLDQQMKLRDWFAKQQGEARTLLASADGLVEELSKKVLGDVDSAEVTVGRLQQFFESKLR